MSVSWGVGGGMNISEYFKLVVSILNEDNDDVVGVMMVVMTEMVMMMVG